MYVFVSFGSIHTRKPLGACVVQVDKAEDANDETKRLGIMPETCNKAFGYLLSDDDFKKQGMELNKFYNAEQLEQMGFGK